MTEAMIRDYLITKIRQKELMSKRLSKYIASFNYFGKSLIVLSATSSGTSITSFATVIGADVGIKLVKQNFFIKQFLVLKAISLKAISSMFHQNFIE